MYLNQTQLTTILNSPYWALPVTENMTNYSLYRGRQNVRVLTIRFNLIATFDETRMIQTLMTMLTNYFPVESRLLSSVNYDLLLCEPQSKSYYIWRANTNQALFNVSQETPLKLNYANVFRFSQNSSNVHVPDLSLSFRQSNVVIEKILAIVFTFVR